MYQILFFVLIMHFIGDFPLQSDFLANMKGKFDYILFCHVMIWTGCIAAALMYFSVFAWWKIAFLAIGHFFIDRWKSHKADKSAALTKDLWLDQLLHAAQVIIVSIF